MAKVKINTTQNVRLEYEPASVGDRIIATIIDALIIYGFVVSLIIFAFQFGRHLQEEVFVFLFFLALFPIIFYHLLSEIFLNGQSVGKRVRKIKILKLDGTEPSLSAYFIRWLLRPVDLFFYGLVAIITISVNGRGQRLGDIAAGTTVVKLKPKVTLNDLLAYAETTPSSYQPTYWQVTALSKKDIEIIQNVLDRLGKQKDSPMLDQLAEKVKQHLRIQTPDKSYVFLTTILKDYMYFTSQE
ncbi:MAG: RDD family protein [Microscillaceae bacterium]|nr:RDD family protein [Microscillaceae bacterium]MDW8461019.1 RDD family protein [Cytophagales bacterium]